MGPGSMFVGGLAVIAVAVMIAWPRKGLIARLRKSIHLSERVLVEDGLKHIHGCESREQQAQLDGVAGKLSISMNHAAALVARMTKEGLVVSDSTGINLTDAGTETAVQLIRAHRLWERYLSEETGFGEGEWHSRAEIKEHTISPETINELADRLGNPTYDPHGDPIPTGTGEIPHHGRGVPLISVNEGQYADVVHVEDEPEAVYAQLVAENVYPGVRIHVIEKTPNRIRFYANGERHTLAPIVARNLTVVPVDEAAEPNELEGTEALSGIEVGREAEVVGIAPSCRGAERRRLLDLGIVPGTHISAEMRSPGGDPTAYRVRETLIALREKQAQHVRVQTIKDERAPQENAS